MKDKYNSSLVLLFSTFYFSIVLSAHIGYAVSDELSARAEAGINVRGFLLEALNGYFCNLTKPSILCVLNATSGKESEFQANQPVQLFKLPVETFFVIEKYLDANDVVRLSMTSRFIKLVMDKAVRLNISSFCPHFVLPDNILNRIFYHSIIKPLGVESIHDESMKDIIQLWTLKRVYNDLPVPYKISPLVFDQMFMCLFEAVNGLNSTVPLTKDAQRLFFSKQYNEHDLPKTVEYIETVIGLSEYKMDMMNFIKSNPSDQDIRYLNSAPEPNTNNKLVEFVNLKSERLWSDIDNNEIKYESFITWLEAGIFNSHVFEELKASGFNLQRHLVLSNLPALRAIFTDRPDSNVFYALSRDATELFDHNNFRSLAQEICPHLFSSLVEDKSTNLAQIDVISKMIRFGIIDLSHLVNPHRICICTHRSYNSDIIEMILNEMPGLINSLLGRRSSSDNILRFYSMHENYSPGQLSQHMMSIFINHIKSKTNDPLPLLFLPESRFNESLTNLVCDKFDLNKKYIFDFDFELVILPFMEHMYHVDIARLKWTVIDFKTLLSKYFPRIPKSRFTSDVTEFDKPTPEDVPIYSLKRYFEDAVFEVFTQTDLIAPAPNENWFSCFILFFNLFRIHM